jgi:hypothetical protein
MKKWHTFETKCNHSVCGVPIDSQQDGQTIRTDRQIKAKVVLWRHSGATPSYADYIKSSSSAVTIKATHMNKSK